MSQRCAHQRLPVLCTFDELVALVTSAPGSFVRCSEGPESDRGRRCVDAESGLELPGLSVSQLYPEPWWTRPLDDWIARQLCRYLHLSEHGTVHHGWVLRGQVVGRGSDDQPLVTDVEPMALLTEELLAEAFEWYQKRFVPGRGSR